jgi:hypothetical protein
MKMCLNEAYSKDHVAKKLSDNFPVQNSLKEGDDLLPLHYSFALQYTIRKVQESQA